MREWSSRSCHIRLQWLHPPGILVLQLKKWRTSISIPLHAGNPQAIWLPLSILSRGPIVLQPSLHIWIKASIAACSCKYTFSSSILRSFSSFLCDKDQCIRMITQSQSCSLMAAGSSIKVDDSQNQLQQQTPKAPVRVQDQHASWPSILRWMQQFWSVLLLCGYIWRKVGVHHTSLLIGEHLLHFLYSERNSPDTAYRLVSVKEQQKNATEPTNGEQTSSYLLLHSFNRKMETTVSDKIAITDQTMKVLELL